MADDKPENGAEKPRPEGVEPAAPDGQAAAPDAAPGGTAPEATPEAAPAPPVAPEPEAAPASPAGAEPEPEPEPHPLVSALLGRFSSGVSEDGADAIDNPIVRVDADALLEVMAWLRDEDAAGFDYLSSLTVIDWTEREPRFDVVYNLYSLANNHNLTVKVGCADGEGIASVSEIWGTANWHEREAYDLYGVEFLGHPELERIFLPEDWHGFPLRKDYPLEGPNLELLSRQQAAFRGGRFDRIRGDYEMSDKERELAKTGIVGALWTPKPAESESDAEAGEPGESRES